MLSQTIEKSTKVSGLVLDDETPSIATANTAKINAALASDCPIVELPYTGRNSFIAINGTLLLPLNKSVTLAGYGEQQTKLKVIDGANLDAVIATEAWETNAVGTFTFATHRGVVVKDLSIDCNFYDPAGNAASPTELQTAGLGHGLVISGYQCIVESMYIENSRGHAFFLSSVAKDGTTGLGPSIENKFIGITAERSGLCGFSSEGIPGSYCTDGWLINSVIDTSNLREVTGFQSHAVFIRNAGGWMIQGNHLYNQEFHVGGVAGIPGSKTANGYHILSAYGTRMVNNKFDDWGLNTLTTTNYGIFVQGKQDRPFVIANCEFNSDESVAANTYRCIGTTTPGGENITGNITGNTWVSRNATNTLQGIYAGIAGGGTVNLQITGNSCPSGSPLPFQLAGPAVINAPGGVSLEGNSWQRGSGPLTGAWYPAGYKVWAADPVAAGADYWINTVTGIPGTWVSRP